MARSVCRHSAWAKAGTRSAASAMGTAAGRHASPCSEDPARNSSRAMPILGRIWISTSPTLAAPTFLAGPTCQSPVLYGDGAAVTTSDRASARPCSWVMADARASSAPGRLNRSEKAVHAR